MFVYFKSQTGLAGSSLIQEWLVTGWAPSHYLNQSYIVHIAHGKKTSVKFMDQSYDLFSKYEKRIYLQYSVLLLP